MTEDTIELVATVRFEAEQLTFRTLNNFCHKSYLPKNEFDFSVIVDLVKLKL